jgi:hypothetical protein
VSAPVLRHTLVVRHPETFTPVALLAGQPVPEWATDLDLVQAEDLVDAEAAETEGGPPPKTGAGSGKGEWLAYARDELGLVLDDNASKGDIVEQVEAHLKELEG